MLKIFKYFHAYVKREKGRQLKCIQVDNGGESRGPFEKYYKEHSIKLEKTVLKTPQQNGVAKRMSHTIVERIRCMLSNAKLLNSFKGETIKTIIDLINLSLLVPFNGDIPQRVWTKRIFLMAI